MNNGEETLREVRGEITFKLFRYKWNSHQAASGACFGGTHRRRELSLLSAFRKELKLVFLSGEELIIQK